MCFAPQRRALFRHLNLQKWREHVVLCTFWLRNVLRATTACTFSTSQLPKVVRSWCALYIFTSKCASQLPKVVRSWCALYIFTSKCASQLPKVVRTWCVLCILTWKCASRHNGVHFFNISTSQSGPNPPSVRFNTFYFQMCFAPQRRATFHLSSPQMSPHPPL